jgi:hypothetical protein
MRRPLVWLLVLACACGGSAAAPRDAASEATDAAAEAPTGAVAGATDGGTTLCKGLGWCELTNTKLADVCPDPAQVPAIQANEGCAAVIADWSGGIADQTRDRLLLWGGGHKGYFGNELYALDLPTVKMLRLTDPSDVSAFDPENCAADAYADGRPVSRHTYDGLAYVASADRMYAFGGAVAGMGCIGNGTWTLDLAGLATVQSAAGGQAAPWMNMKPAGMSPGAFPGAMSDFDPRGNRVIVHDTVSLWAYDFDTNKYASLRQNAATDYHLTGRVDPKRNLFVAVGGLGAPATAGLVVFPLDGKSDHAPQNWTTQVKGCDALLRAPYPGLAYDPVQDKLVGWVGGNQAVVLDLDKKACTTLTFPGGPGPAQVNGTMGRFRYFDTLRVFVVVNDWKQNAFALRLTK